jgi:hypothetical protein
VTRRDRIWVDSHAVHGTRRAGEIVEVLGQPDRPRYRVRWEDGRETIIYPGSDALVSLAGAKRPKPGKPRPRARKATAGPARPPAPAGVRAAPGDRLVVRPHHVGEPGRDAEILEVGPDGGPPFRVRWEDTGDESLVFPGSDVSVEHFPAAKRPRRAGRSRAT